MKNQIILKRSFFMLFTIALSMTIVSCSENTPQLDTTQPTSQSYHTGYVPEAPTVYTAYNKGLDYGTAEDYLIEPGPKAYLMLDDSYSTDYFYMYCSSSSGVEYTYCLDNSLSGYGSAFTSNCSDRLYTMKLGLDGLNLVNLLESTWMKKITDDFSPGDTVSCEMAAVLADGTTSARSPAVQFQMPDDSPFVIGSGTIQRVAEGSIDYFDSSNTAYISLVLNPRPSQSGSIDYATSDGTATAGSDYTATTGTLTWFAGDQNLSNISIPIIADSAIETTEHFNITLSNPVNASLANSTITVEIIDDDSLTGVPPVHNDMFIPELQSYDDGVSSHTNIGSTWYYGHSIRYTTADGTATAGVDYTALDSITTGGQIPITILADPNFDRETGSYSMEGPETITLTVTDTVTNAASTATLTILDAILEEYPFIYFTSKSQTVSEGSLCTITLAISELVGYDITIPYTLSGTATNGVDYRAMSMTPIVLPANTSSVDITFTPTADYIAEGNENMIMTLGTPDFAFSISDIHTVTITD
ncbi:MAG: hypothetical protein KKB30_12955 [Proteobacteria bacterium]|nr:hypothetical protein [Pseudomonadota bacterium]MBU1714878.1 hypothetical protein [Pseudomonadota bacterium]